MAPRRDEWRRERWYHEDRWEKWIGRRALPYHHINKSLFLLVVVTYLVFWVWWSYFLLLWKVPSLGSTAQSWWCPKFPLFDWSIALFMAYFAELFFQNGTWLYFRSELLLSSRSLSTFAWMFWDLSSNRFSSHWLVMSACMSLQWIFAFFVWFGWKVASYP